MRKKQEDIGSIKKKKIDAIYPVITIVLLVVLWEVIVRVFEIPGYLLPSPSKIFHSLAADIGLIGKHAKFTVYEAGVGLASSIVLALIIAIVMDNFKIVKKALYPLLIISQTIPVMAVAPLLLIWFGFGTLPKIILIVLMCFFPIAVSLIDGFSQVDTDYLNLFHVLKASRFQVYRYLKFPNALPYFFSGLKISITYTVMGAVIAEWLGGNDGIGVYMLRSKNAFALDKVFAAIILVVTASLILISMLNLINRKVVHWK